MASVRAKWTRIVANARLQRSSQSLCVIGSQAWIFGGELEPRVPVDNQLDVVELQTGGASTKTLPPQGEVPIPRVGSASTVLNGKLHLFSGRGGVAMAPIEENGGVWCFDPSEQKWTLISPADPNAPYPAARSYHTMTSDANYSVYVHAGCPEKGRLSDLWSFNTSTRTWTELGAAPDPPRGGASITYCAGKVYRMNGFDGTKEQGGSLDLYDIGANSWTSISYSADGVSGPEPRSVCALLAVKAGGKGLLVTMFGEHDPSTLGHARAGKMLRNVWAFDLESRKWKKIELDGEVPAARGWFDADVEKLNGKDAIIVHGGLAEDNSRLGDVWRLDIS